MCKLETPPPRSPHPPSPSTDRFSSPLPFQASCGASDSQLSQKLQNTPGDPPLQPVPLGGCSERLAERHLEAVEVLRDVSRLRKTLGSLGPRVAALEEGRVQERAERSRLQEQLSGRGNWSVAVPPTDQCAD